MTRHRAGNNVDAMECRRSSGSRPFVALVALSALLVMGPATGCDDPAPDPVVHIGSSDEPLRHREVAEGSPVWITYGLQGGYHIWGSLRAEHIDPRDVRMQFDLFVQGEQVGGSDYRDDLRRGPEGPYEYGAVTVFIYDDIAVEDLDGRTVEMALRLTDGAGRLIEDRTSVVARCCE